MLPLVPVYLGYLSGSTLSGNASPNRRQIFSHALSFVGGFTLIFVILFGLPTTILGSALQQHSRWIAGIGGAIVILFGLHTMGIVPIPALDVTCQVETRKEMEPGYARSTLFGMTFAAGWTPCIGPLLGTVIALGFTEPSRAAGFIFAYAMGLAIPFLMTAALLMRIARWLKRLNRHMRAVEIASGLLMASVGVLLVTGRFSSLNSYFIRITPEWLVRYL